MQTVKVTIGASPTHGIGLFADQFIPKGTATWRFQAGFDQEFTQEEVDGLPKQAQEFIAYYAYFSERKQRYVLVADHDRFINHSTNPNIGIAKDTETEEGHEYALSDIQPGEELTCNYFDFDETAAARHLPKT